MSMVNGNDSLLALGGVLNAAVEAYRGCEEKRVDEIRRVREDHSQEMKSMREELRREILNEVRNEMRDELQKLRTLPNLRFDLSDFVGVWFDLGSKVRVVIAEDGTVSYDDGTPKKSITWSNGCFNLGETFVLSLEKSSRRKLIWEGAGKTTTWIYENISGSRQLILTLDVAKVVYGHQYQDRASLDLMQQKSFDFRFSLIGCEVVLVLCREESKCHAGKDCLGVFFGLEKSQVKVGTSPINVDAINCRIRIDLYNPKSREWLPLCQTSTRRYEAGKERYGQSEAMPFDQFLEIVGPLNPESRYYHETPTAKFRVTVIDIGMLELAQTSAHKLAPILLKPHG